MSNAGPMWAMTQSSPGTFTRLLVPRPDETKLAPGKVLLRVTAGGICGSDLPFLHGRQNPYAAPGTDAEARAFGFPLHEVAGEVLASTDDRFTIGDLVVGWAEAFDGLAELVVTGADSLCHYDVALTPTAAVLMQPLACVLYAVERLGDVSGRTCAVLGLGPIGVLFSHVLASRGAAHVVGVDPVDRREVGKHFGVDEVVVGQSGPWAAALDEADRPEVVVEAVGHQVETLQDALVAVRPSGSIFYFGVPDSPMYPLDMERLVRKHLTLRAGGTLERPRMLAEAGDYLAQHPDLIENVITDVYDVSHVQEAYDRAARPAPGRLKVCLNLGGSNGSGG